MTLPKQRGSTLGLMSPAMRRPKGMMEGGMAKAHPGFEAEQAKIASEEGVSEERAGAILASSSRNASAAAKRKNPRLNRVKGKAKRSKGKNSNTTTVYGGGNNFRSY